MSTHFPDLTELMHILNREEKLIKIAVGMGLLLTSDETSLFMISIA